MQANCLRVRNHGVVIAMNGKHGRISLVNIGKRGNPLGDGRTFRLAAEPHHCIIPEVWSGDQVSHIRDPIPVDDGRNFQAVRRQNTGYQAPPLA